MFNKSHLMENFTISLVLKVVYVKRWPYKSLQMSCYYSNNNVLKWSCSCRDCVIEHYSTSDQSESSFSEKSCDVVSMIWDRVERVSQIRACVLCNIGICAVKPLSHYLDPPKPVFSPRLTWRSSMPQC